MLKTILAVVVILMFLPHQSFAMVGCSEAGATQTGKPYKIKGSEVNVRQGPGVKYNQVINQKSSAILHKKDYVHVDNTTIVYEECSVNGWSKVRVTAPDYLSQSHRGWIMSKFLREKKINASGFEEFTADDFIWTKGILPYKDIIVAGVNKVHKENSSCKDIDPSSAYISGSKGTKANPVFFVTCGVGVGIHNVFFSKSDVEMDKKMRAVQPIGKSGALRICHDAIMRKANFPSTVDFHTLTGTSVYEAANGNTDVRILFDAKNALGNELPYKARCLILPNGKLVTINIQGR